MVVKIQTIDESIQSNGLKICVHGPAGSGKTVLTTTTGTTGIILSAENGLLSLKEAPKEVKNNMGVMQIASMAEIGEAFEILEKERMSEWLFPDSISEIAEVVLHIKKEENRDPRKAYGDMADEMLGLIRALRDLPGYNVMMTAKQHRVKDDISGVTLYAPMLPGRQLGDQIPYLFDEVFALRVEPDGEDGVVRVLQTGKDLTFEAKDRSGKLDMYEPADLAHIAKKIGTDTTVPAPRKTIQTENSTDKPKLKKDGEDE